MGPELSSGVGSWVGIVPFDLGSRGQQARLRQLALYSGGAELGGRGLIAGGLPPYSEPNSQRSRGRSKGPLWSLYLSHPPLYFLLPVLLKKWV